MSALPADGGGAGRAADGDSEPDDYDDYDAALFGALGIDNDAEMAALLQAKPRTPAPMPPTPTTPRALAVAFSVHDRQRERSVCFRAAASDDGAPRTPTASAGGSGYDWQGQFDGRVTRRTKNKQQHNKQHDKQQQQQQEEETLEQMLAPPGPGDTAAVFGVALEEGVRRTARVSPDLPDVVAACLACIERDGLGDVGVFRVPGSLREVARLRAAAQHGAAPDVAAAADVHVATSLLKLYLRELPASLLAPRPDVAPAHAAAGAATAADPDTPEAERVAALRTLVGMLHAPRRRVLCALCALLARVDAAQARTRMGARNLAIVLSPSLHSDVETVAGLITHYAGCFDAARDAPRLPDTWPLLPPPSQPR